MDKMIKSKLSVMMFLEFFIWGAWLPLIFGYLPSLGFTALQQSWILNAFALASFTGMFFSNQFADRNFAAERFLAVSHLIGGLAILALAWTQSFWPFFILMLVHSLFYVPTISITNSVAFANLKDPQHDFGPVRLWGTIGWIAASWPFVFILVDWANVPSLSQVGFVQWLGSVLGTSKSGAALQQGVTWTFIAAGIASLVLAGFSLVLPHTPPRPAKEGNQTFAWLEAMKLLAVPFVLILFVVTFFDAAVHQCYFIWTNDFLKSVGIPANWVMPVMSIGQVAEIGTMAILGTFLKALGWRKTMVIGILGHAARFGIFALAPYPALAVLINVLHGVCYAFFFATVYIFVDEFFPKDARSSAQGLFNFLILGFGPFIANFVWPLVGDMVKSVDVTAEVVRTADGAPKVVVKGIVRNPAEKGTISVTQMSAGQTKGSQSSSVGSDGSFSVEFQDIEPGTYAFQIGVERYAPVFSRVQGTVELGSVKVAEKAGSKEETPVAAKEWDFWKLFLAPAGTALFAGILLLLLFHPPAKSGGETGPVALSH